MRIPLRYQITEFDCGPTSLINAFSYLYDREEIPADLIKAISLYTLDQYENKYDTGGTSEEAMSFLSKWLMTYAKNNEFNLICQRFEKDEVTLDGIRKRIGEKGVLIVRLMLGCEHYVILTDIDDEYVYLFDPYYFEAAYYDNDSEVKIIFDNPFKFNRKVTIARFMSDGDNDFSLGKIVHREYVVIKRS